MKRNSIETSNVKFFYLKKYNSSDYLHHLYFLNYGSQPWRVYYREQWKDGFVKCETVSGKVAEIDFIRSESILRLFFCTVQNILRHGEMLVFDSRLHENPLRSKLGDGFPRFRIWARRGHQLIVL